MNRASVIFALFTSIALVEALQTNGLAKKNVVATKAIQLSAADTGMRHLAPPSAQAAKAKATASLEKVIRKMQAINTTLGQLDDIVNETNTTLNQVVDQVLQGTQSAVTTLDTLKAAAAAVGQFGMESAAEAVTKFADQIISLVVENQDKLSGMREDVQSTIDKYVIDFLALRDQVVSSFAEAMEQAAVLDDVTVPVSLLQVNQGVWPFDSIFGGKKKDAFDKAEDAIIKANATVAKVASYLDDVNASSIELMTGLVLGTVQSAIAQFEEKCQAAVDAQGTNMPDVLGTQASSICTKPNSVLGQLTPMVDSYEQMLLEKIVTAQESIQPLFEATDTLMGMVEDARTAQEAAANATASR